jgi:hypothetical protein
MHPPSLQLLAAEYLKVPLYKTKQLEHTRTKRTPKASGAQFRSSLVRESPSSSSSIDLPFLAFFSYPGHMS